MAEALYLRTTAIWGTTGECMKYLLRRAQENKDAVQRTKGGRDAMFAELVRRLNCAWAEALTCVHFHYAFSSSSISRASKCTEMEHLSLLAEVGGLTQKQKQRFEPVHLRTWVLSSPSKRVVSSTGPRLYVSPKSTTTNRLSAPARARPQTASEHRRFPSSTMVRGSKLAFVAGVTSIQPPTDQARLGAPITTLEGSFALVPSVRDAKVPADSEAALALTKSLDKHDVPRLRANPDGIQNSKKSSNVPQLPFGRRPSAFFPRSTSPPRPSKHLAAIPSSLERLVIKVGLGGLKYMLEPPLQHRLSLSHRGEAILMWVRLLRAAIVLAVGHDIGRRAHGAIAGGMVCAPTGRKSPRLALFKQQQQQQAAQSNRFLQFLPDDIVRTSLFLQNCQMLHVLKSRGRRRRVGEPGGRRVWVVKQRGVRLWNRSVTNMQIMASQRRRRCSRTCSMKNDEDVFDGETRRERRLDLMGEALRAGSGRRSRSEASGECGFEGDNFKGEKRTLCGFYISFSIKRIRCHEVTGVHHLLEHGIRGAFAVVISDFVECPRELKLIHHIPQS
ncbi:hypothetical protein G7046_g8272 [Stylonectria norvegica]|nr:hypothetical protein G7046_g8272 [Stylonectria norvegica]